MKNISTMHEMIETRINGNISDFNVWARTLTVLDTADLIECACGYFGIEINVIIRWIRAAHN
jgi:hypothetical protein